MNDSSPTHVLLKSMPDIDRTVSMVCLITFYHYYLLTSIKRIYNRLRTNTLTFNILSKLEN